MDIDDLNDLINQIYYQKKTSGNFDLEKWLKIENISYYSLARYALVDALNVLGTKKADRVAVPELICREVVEAIKITGASICYYPIDESLKPFTSMEMFMDVSVIIIVNYFGFPQDLTFFNKVASTTGAKLIEDNAHGFLSKDKNGIPLGKRTSIGIISIRKSIRTIDGAALLLNDESIKSDLINHKKYSEKGVPFGFILKKAISNIAPVIGARIFMSLITAVRTIKKTLLQYKKIEQTVFFEMSDISPHIQFKEALKNIIPDEEVARRRKLYYLAEKEVCSKGGIPIFTKLDINISPYAFPFRADREGYIVIKKHLNSIGMDCYLWPELPDDIIKINTKHYSNILMVPLLW